MTLHNKITKNHTLLLPGFYRNYFLRSSYKSERQLPVVFQWSPSGFLVVSQCPPSGQPMVLVVLSCVLSSSDPEEAVKWQHGRPAAHVGQGLRGVSAPELQSYATLRQEQRPGAARMSAILNIKFF